MVPVYHISPRKVLSGLHSNTTVKVGGIKNSAQKKEKDGAEREKPGDGFSHLEVRASGQSQQNVDSLQNHKSLFFEPLSAQDMLINGSDGDELSKVPTSHACKITTNHRTG